MLIINNIANAEMICHFLDSGNIISNFEKANNKNTRKRKKAERLSIEHSNLQ